MARCKHGFEPAAVKCPEGCHGTRAALPKFSKDGLGPPERSRHTDAEVIAVLREASSLRAAAKELGVVPKALWYRAKRNPEIAVLYKQRRKQPHPGLQNMVGFRCGSWLVVARAPNATDKAVGTARWVCRHSCEAQTERVIEGIRLRHSPPKYCSACKPRATGIVLRRSA